VDADVVADDHVIAAGPALAHAASCAARAMW
jgi:hypothetical protein